MILRPDADVTTEWTPSGAINHWDCIDDAVTQPTAGSTAEGIQAGGAFTDEVGLTTDASLGGNVMAVDVWVYGERISGAGNATITLRKGATQIATGSWGPASIGWTKVCTYTGNLTQAEVDDLRIRFLGSFANTFSVYTAYADVTAASDKTSEVSNQTRSRRPMPMFRGPDVDRQARARRLR